MNKFTIVEFGESVKARTYMAFPTEEAALAELRRLAEEDGGALGKDGRTVRFYDTDEGTVTYKIDGAAGRKL